jgi:uncharacterized repeat protein (TIGR02543 family)
MNKRKISVQFLLYFLMMIFLTVTVSCSGSSSPPVIQYTVTFDSQGADGAVNTISEKVTAPATTVGTLPAAPKKTGYIFAGWWTGVGGSGTEFTASTPVTADITVYAYWSPHPVYTVTYDSQGGTPVDAQHVTSPATTVGTLPTPPTYAGYTFAGWYTGTIGSGTAFTASTPVTANITVYANWNSYSYSVAFDSQGATVAAKPASKTVTSPATTVVTLPSAPTRTGYTFAGWWTGIGGTGTEFTATTVVTETKYVYAYWSANPVYTVTYDSQGGTAVDAQHVTLPATTVGTLPAAPSRKGYTFGGWYTGTGGTGTAFTASTPVTANITVYANWNSFSYTVTFDSQGATVAANPTSKMVTSPAFTVDTLPTAPTKTGYIFSGWWTGTDGSGTAFTASTTVWANITVYAYWSTNPVYTVTYDSQGGTAVGAQNVTSPATTVGVLPVPPTKTGYTFAGWWTGVSGSGTEFTATTVVKANIKVYAYWSPNFVYTVTYDSQGGTPVDAQHVTSPATTVGTLPTPPTYAGYTFAGWWTENSGGTAFTASTPVTADITVYAQWNSYSYSVAFDSQGATVAAKPASKTVTSPATTVVTLPSAPTRTGYTFAGWWTGVGGTGTEFTATTVVTETMHVYAYWSANPVYTVTYDSQGGTAVDAQHVTLPATTVGTLPTAPTKSGYTFGGWYTETSGAGTEFTASTPVTASITVHANWN